MELYVSQFYQTRNYKIIGKKMLIVFIDIRGIVDSEVITFVQTVHNIYYFGLLKLRTKQRLVCAPQLQTYPQYDLGRAVFGSTTWCYLQFTRLTYQS